MPKSNKKDSAWRVPTHQGNLNKPRKPASCPKRPLSGYLMYAAKNRKSISAKNPTLKMTDVSKLVGAAWRKLSDGSQKTFNDQSLDGYKDYNIAYANYKKSTAYQVWYEKVEDWKEQEEE
jgi:hypothetical protein|tara:strand:+ start:37 stop:396 length:360 start_codon:yes stop_codon:yes gene_type:complete